ncbi:hypothetical protein Tco_1090796 [Tanacetum coccineum]|uniref:Uncharacterized protein n=1 Tax=Tanacetum coccineum TaxID=301880 RepID=A0ABQ5I5D0_9ASTR
MPYPRFTKIIINHFLSLNPFIPKGPSSVLHTIKDDGVISRMKFVRIGGLSRICRGKGSQGKKPFVTPTPASVEVFDESDPKPAKRQTGSRRSRGVVIQDTPNVPNKKSVEHPQKLKGVTLTIEEQFVADTMQALKASRKSSRNKPQAGGLSEGTSITPGVPDESRDALKTSSEGTGSKIGVPDEVKGASEAKANSAIDLGSEEEKEENKDDDEDDRSIDIENTDDDEEIDDEFLHGDEYVCDDVDEEMKDVEDPETGKDDEELTNAEKTEATKGDLEQAGKLPLTSSSLFGSSGFEVPHIQSSSILTVPISVILEPIIISPIPDIPLVTPTTTLPPPSYVTTSTPVLQQTTTPIPIPPITTVALATTTVPDPLPVIAQRVSFLKKDIQELKQVVHSVEFLHQLDPKYHLL